METISVHPYEPHICQGATKLIIGTIPPYRFCTNRIKKLYDGDIDFYYGSRDNYFWNLMFEITNQKLQHEKNSKEAIEERKALLDSLKIGIMDIVKTCIHKNGKSDDKSLDNIELNSELIKEKLLEFPSINTLIYTSRFVISQMIDKSISDNYHKWNPEDKMDGTIDINGKKYQVRILYSPSPSASRRVSKQKRLERYKAVFK